MMTTIMYLTNQSSQIHQKRGEKFKVESYLVKVNSCFQSEVNFGLSDSEPQKNLNALI